jgi:NAD(P)H-quinone oxidoreductase subunit 5
MSLLEVASLALFGPARVEVMLLGLPWVLGIDGLGSAFGALLAMLAWALLRFTAVHLDGELREGPFVGALLLAMAAGWVLAHGQSWAPILVALAVQGWAVAQLLGHYGERAAARRQAQRFQHLWWLGDGALWAAAFLLLRAPVLPWGLEAEALAALLLGLAAMMKAALLPFHRWLTEALDVPVPVSALFHAGVISAGVLVLLRHAPLLARHPEVLLLLGSVGAVSVLGGLVLMAVQGTVKQSLAFSTVNQMGLLMVQLSLQLWPLALFHALSHGLYKAHGFLQAGSAVAPPAAPSQGARSSAWVWGALAAHLLGYGALVIAIPLLHPGVQALSPAALALGAFLAAALGARCGGLLRRAQGSDDRRLLGALSLLLLPLFLLTHEAAYLLWDTSFPAWSAPSPALQGVLMVGALLGTLLSLALALVDRWHHRPWAEALRCRLVQGLPSLPRLLTERSAS